MSDSHARITPREKHALTQIKGKKPRDHASEPFVPHTHPRPTVRDGTKASVRWQVVSSYDRPSAAQYTRPKGVDDVVIGFPSSRNAMPGTGAWGVAALDFRSRLDVPLKKELRRELVFRAEQRASARGDMRCNISRTFCSICLALRRAGVVSCWCCLGSHAWRR